ncbi:caspase-3-like isoform X1 [Lampetra planeri]
MADKEDKSSPSTTEELKNSGADGGDGVALHDATDAYPSRSERGIPFLQSKTGKRKEEKMEVDQEVLSDSVAYNMNYSNVGYCVIINNKTFDRSTGMGERTGTDVDRDMLEKQFKGLGFQVEVKNNMKRKEMVSYITEVAEKDHRQCACFVCILLSHGDEGVIYGTDDYLPIRELTTPFRGDLCRHLVGKPKLFFIQACRGTDFDEGATTCADNDVETDSDSISRQTIPVEADFLYCYSTVPGYYSWRNVATGSWFVQAFCKVLKESANSNLELMQLLTRVNRKVAYDYISFSSDTHFSGKKQIPCIVSMLTKEFHFPSPR